MYGLSLRTLDGLRGFLRSLRGRSRRVLLRTVSDAGSRGLG